MGQCLYEQARSGGNSTALETGQWSCTWEELDRITDYLAGEMLEDGITKGTHAGLWSINSPGWVLTFLALVKIGAVPVLINTCFKGTEVQRVMEYSDARVLYYGAGYKTADYGEIVRGLKGTLSKTDRFISLENAEYERWREKELEEKLAERLQAAKTQVKPSDSLCMIFTSGTTSIPKGVMLSHFSVVNNAKAMTECLHWGTEDRLCLSVPLFHCFGITAGLTACIISGMSMYLLPYFKTASVWDAVEWGKCTVLNGVPSMFLAMIQKPEYKNRNGDGIRSGIVAGSPVTKEEFFSISSRFSNAHLLPSYGQTETSPCVTMAGWNDSLNKRGSGAGKAIAHVEIRIGDISSGRILPAGMDGEIQVRGYNVMQGYYNLPQVNEAAFTTDGWLKTGDTGYMDEDGELHVTGRIKEMIIRAGENISPYEIEEVIGCAPWVSQVKVIGVPAKVVQEEIAACIIPKAGCDVCKEELMEYLSPRLAYYKIPSYVLTFEEFPMNASGKINLKILKRMAQEKIGNESLCAHNT